MARGGLSGIGGRGVGSKVRYGGFAARINIRAIRAIAVLAVVGALAGGLAGEAACARRHVVLVFGDSLTSGFGLEAGQSFPARLEAALAEAGRDVEVINAGVAGDTTTGGRARLAWSLARTPDAVIVALGANDGLRGIDPALTAANLNAILAELERRGLPVLLTGMYAPPNLGREYGAAFNAVFPGLAKKRGVAFYPFFLDGVAARPALNQADGIHPNAAGVAVMVRRILPYVVELLP